MLTLNQAAYCILPTSSAAALSRLKILLRELRGRLAAFGNGLQAEAVELRRGRVVFLLDRGGLGYVVHVEPLKHLGVAAQAHHLDLLLRPRIHRDRPHKADMHSKRPVHTRALQAEERAVRDRRPLRVLRVAVHASLNGHRALVKVYCKEVR